MNRICQSDRNRFSLNRNHGLSLIPAVRVPIHLQLMRLSVVLFLAIFFFPFCVGVQAQDEKADGSDDTKSAADQLPPGYVAPPERLAIMDLDHPIADKDELARLKKDHSRFAKTKIECDLSPAGKKVVENSVRYRLAEMTTVKQSEIPNIHRRFVEEATNVGSSTSRAQDAQEMSRYIGQEVLKNVREVMKYSFYVRLHNVESLGEINFSPAFDALVKILQSKDITEDDAAGQPEAIKIAAVNSLIRILRFANPSAKERTAIANALVVELEKAEAFWWRQLRLIEALRYCDNNGIDVGNNDRPYIVESLLAVVRDQRRPWKVRTRACYALGRVAIPKSAKPDEVVTAIAECALAMSNEVMEKPKEPDWKKCYANLYLAFQPGGTAKDKDMDSEKKQPGGLMNKFRSAAQPAYQVLLPIFNDVRIASDDPFITKAPSADNLRKLEEFVRGRQGQPQAQN